MNPSGIDFKSGKGETQRMQNDRRLFQIREALGYTQRQMAEEFKVTSGAIAHWESGTREIPGPVLKLLEIYEEELGFQAKDSHSEVGSLKKTSKGLGRSLKMAKSFSLYWFSSILKKAIQAEEAKPGFKQRIYQALIDNMQNELGELKAFPQKLGQVLSYLEFSMPSEAQQSLGQLRSQSKAYHSEAIEAAFSQSLGQKPQKLFSKWSKEPLAVGSLGQVHFAQTQAGEKVAVKVQFPEIEEALKSDIETLGKFKNFTHFFITEKQPGEIYDELSKSLLEECDYLLEAKNQKQFRELFHLYPHIHVPAIYEEYSSRTVLCSEYVGGMSYEEFKATASQVEKQKAGEAIWQFTYESVFKHGIYNTDPHPGNYLFNEASVSFLDFGSIKRIDPDFLKHWQLLIKNLMDGKPQEVFLQNLLDMRFIEDLEGLHKESLLKLIYSFYEPLLKHPSETYQCNTRYIQDSFSAWFKANPNLKKMRFSKDWLYLTRAMWGVAAILAELNVEANWQQKMRSLLTS